MDTSKDSSRSSKKHFTMIHIKAQSMWNKQDELTAESAEADIITVTETWLKEEISNEDVRIANFMTH